MAIDGSGNLFVGDVGNAAVKEVVAAGGYTTVKTVSTFLSLPYGVAVDGNGDVFVADQGGSVIYEIVAVNGSIPATSPTVRCWAADSMNPQGVAVDGSGNVFVADYNNHAVQEILAANGYTSVITLANSVDPTALAVDAAGDIFFSDDITSKVNEILAVNGAILASPTVVTLGSGFSTPYGLAVDGSGNVFVADSGHNQVVKLDYADPPTLNFATTNPGSTSSDSPQTVTIINDGNMPLTFSVPSAGTNPSITLGFTNRRHARPVRS